MSFSSSSTSPRTATVSEFVSFLFRSQLVVDAPTSTSSSNNSNDPNDPNSNPEFDGLNGMMLRTFSESSRREEESEWVYSRRSSLNRSRFDNARRVDDNHTMSGRTSSSETQTDGAGAGWRVYGHSRQSSASSTDSA